MTRFWLAFTTPPMKEREAQKHLRSRGLQVFIPMISKEVRVKGSRTMALRMAPAIPGYVFVGFDMWRMDRFHEAKDNKYIRGVLLIDGKPGRISDEVMTFFVNGLCQFKHHAPQFRLQRGDQAPIKAGKFAELLATVLHASGTKAKVRVQMFGRSCETIVAVSQLGEPLVPSTKRAEKDRKLLQRSANQIRHKSGRSASLSPPVSG